MTPLHIACSVGNTDSFYGLLKFCDDHSIKVDEILKAPNRNEMTPLCLAINSKSREMVDTLLKKGAPRTNATMTTAARLAFVFGYYLTTWCSDLGLEMLRSCGYCRELEVEEHL